MNKSNSLDAAFSALAHPVRRAILQQLSSGDATVKELAKPFAMSLPAVSRHIRVLERAGLIDQGKEAQFRPCALNTAPIEQVSSWTQQYRKIWERRFDQMAASLKKMENDDE